MPTVNAFFKPRKIGLALLAALAITPAFAQSGWDAFMASSVNGHSDSSAVAGQSSITVVEGIVTMPAKSLISVSDIYAANSNGSGIQGVKAANSTSKTRANNALAAVLGAGNNVDTLYDRGAYVYAAVDGGEAGAIDSSYVVVSSVALSNDNTYNYVTKGGAFAPVSVFNDKRGATLVPYYSGGSWNPDTQMSVVLDTTSNVNAGGAGDFLIAVAGNGLAYQQTYQGDCVYLNPACAYDDPYYASGYKTFADFNYNRASRAQRAIAGEVASVMAPLQLDSERRFTGTIKDQLTVGHTSAAGFAPGTSLARSGYDLMGGWRVWGSGDALYAKKDMKSGYQGYSYDEYSLTLGADKRFGADNILLGAAASYGWGDFRTRDDSVYTYMDVVHFGLYGGMAIGDALFVNGGLGYSYYNYRNPTDKTLGMRNGGTEGNNWNAFAQVGYRLDYCNWVIVPTIGLEYSKIDVDDFSMGGGLLAQNVLRMSPGKVDSVRTPIEVALMRDFDGLIGSLRLGWTHEWSNDRPTSRNGILKSGTTNQYNYFTVKGDKLVENYFNAGINLDYNIGRVAASTRYDYTFADGYQAHLLEFRAGVSF